MTVVSCNDGASIEAKEVEDPLLKHFKLMAKRKEFLDEIDRNIRADVQIDLQWRNETYVRIVKPYESSDLMLKVKALEAQMIANIHRTNGIIMQSGWYEHAIYLIIKPSSEQGCYNLTVINAGQGASFHHRVPDPDNIYPALARLWIEFKDIPENVLFTQENWFVNGLVQVQLKGFQEELQRNTNHSSSKPSLPGYFYKTILANFRNFVVPVAQGKDIQVPFDEDDEMLGDLRKYAMSQKALTEGYAKEPVEEQFEHETIRLLNIKKLSIDNKSDDDLSEVKSLRLNIESELCSLFEINSDQQQVNRPKITYTLSDDPDLQDETDWDLSIPESKEGKANSHMINALPCTQDVHTAPANMKTPIVRSPFGNDVLLEVDDLIMLKGNYDMPLSLKDEYISFQEDTHTPFGQEQLKRRISSRLIEMNPENRVLNLLNENPIRQT